MADAQTRLKAVKLTIPVMCGYLFLGTAFGATLAQAGFGPVWALMMSGLVYAGSLQFVMVPLMASGAALMTVALTALMVNARHLFYGVSFIDRFRRMGRLRPYMVFSLTDETYSVFCGLEGEESNGVMLRVALYDQLYWVTGSVVGALLARQLPFDLTGIDFSMTALFIVICLERALNRADRLPVAVGGVCAVACLVLLGPDNFLAPALAATAVLLMAMDAAKGRREASA
ncbi:MAG: AzlC family ABC transporter permease [Clostridia bacterium]|nr:AzlC family ABC transporter permease [Clostridia bacterium]